MNGLRLIVKSLLYHARMNLALAGGVAVGTAVLTGALLVGDSMRGSLRDLTLERLGRVEAVLAPQQFFRAQAAAELAGAPGFAAHFVAAAPAIMLRTSLETDDAQRPRRANQVQLIGSDGVFWKLGPGGPPEPPGPREIVLNAPLAELLGAKPGDTVLLSLPRPGFIPADSALGRKTDTMDVQRVTVKAIIGDHGLGRFALQPNQQVPRNAYVALDWLQDRLEQEQRINTLLVAGPQITTAVPQAAQILEKLWRPTPEDVGLRIRTSPLGYIDISSQRMILDPVAEEAVLAALPAGEPQPALTYLANAITHGKRQIPYSTVAGVDWQADPPLGPLMSVAGQPIGPLGNDEIVLNQWAADDLQAQPGDTIGIDFFEPESTHGAVRERHVEFRLKAVTPLAGPAADRDFTPDVPGVTDQRSMSNWDAPFPFDAARVRPKDERYWDQYRGTPKAFVSLATGRKLWASRFGRTTTIRVPSLPGVSHQELQRKIAVPPRPLGFVWMPVKELGLAAAAGTTPFNVLFLSFSFFVIAAAVMLILLLFQLSVEGRAKELGLLFALGVPRRRVRRWLLVEAILVALVGSFLGLGLGVGYAALMLAGLQTWWLAAIVTPFLTLHVGAASLAIGFFSGTLIAAAVIAWSLRRIGRTAPRRLLAGQTSDMSDTMPGAVGTRKRGRWLQLGGLVLVLALAVGLLTVQMGEEARAGAFFGTAGLALVVLLVTVWQRLRGGATAAAIVAGGGNLSRLALRNAARHAGRSTLTIGLVAAATFLIVAISAFRLDPNQQSIDRDSPNGGFALVAQSDQPVYHSLDTVDGRRELGVSPADERVLATTRTWALRVKSGDDASCLNLYQPRQPRVLGLPESFLERGGFAWDSSAAQTPEDRENPWRMLGQDLGRDPDGVPRVPVVLEKNTAQYALHLDGGVGATYDIVDGRGQTVRLVVVGLLGNSLFQGDLLIAEGPFLKYFPDTSGYRFFLIEAPPEQRRPVAEILERTLGDQGLAVETSGERLARFLAVQNTYLSTFQSLGGLGLLLGSLGLAVVLLRNVVERRGELALLRAVGFARRRLAELVLLENMALLVLGLLVGAGAALLAVLPHVVFGTAAVPWLSLGATLGAVLVFGLLAGGAAVWSALKSPLIPALREE